MFDFELLIPLAAILVGGTAIILPIAGLTARFALKPVVEAFARLKSSTGAEQRLELMETRMALVEEQMHALERDNARLREESEFQKRLESRF